MDINTFLCRFQKQILYHASRSKRKTSKDPQHFKTKNILVESDRCQLGVHCISMVLWVCQRALYHTLSKYTACFSFGPSVKGNTI
ncbi:unnamed protein product [Lactuca saligna]|uniref:Uncharacterized protein n=1 Tax=Lactuca saligna TaxID=75948 RepID=A0AA35VWC4_LACSI|nr:unnamed protein product [Lactuca saligna]